MKIIVCLLVLFVLSNCTKENGVKFYLLTYHFSTGDEVVLRGRIYEKPKLYKAKKGDETGDHIPLLGKYDLIFGYTNSIEGVVKMSFNKTIEGQLYLIYFPSLDGSKLSFSNFQNNRLTGSMELIGNYKSPLKKITVSDGTFKFKWGNAELFGKNDSILTGTWTLQRE